MVLETDGNVIINFIHKLQKDIANLSNHSERGEPAPEILPNLKTLKNGMFIYLLARPEERNTIKPDYRETDRDPYAVIESLYSSER